MREAIGGTWLFQIVIFFILIFTGFMCLTINQTKAFNVKNKIIETIQSHNGASSFAIDEIVSYIKENSYRTTGVMPKEIKANGKDISYTCYTRDGNETTDRPVFCLAKVLYGENNMFCDDGSCELPSMSYYRVVVFYQLDLPIFHDLFNFSLTGDTKVLYGSSD